MTTRLSRRVLLAASLSAMAMPGRAQDGYPKAPVKLVVPSAPGGPTDVMARMKAKLVNSALVGHLLAFPVD